MLLSNGLLDNQQASAIARVKGTFSLTELVTIAAAGHSLASLGATVSDVPEPCTLSLIGAGLLAIGLLRRRACSLPVRVAARR